MNIQHLRTLLTIVEHGSLSAAARAMHLSQPAVTKQMQRLEQELETTLLVRGPRQHRQGSGPPQVALTPAGEQVLAFARDTLGRFEALQEQLALLKTVGRGSLVLAASTIPGEYLLPGLLAAFRVEYPQITVRLTIADTAEVADRVLADEADVGFIGAAVDRPVLRLERLVGDEIVLVMPPDHPLAGREHVPLQALHDQPLVMREEGSGTRRSVERALAAAGHVLPKENIVLTLGSTQAVLQAATQGLGLGFVSARAAAMGQADGHLACVRLDGVDLRRDLYLAYLPQRPAEPLIAHFLAFARSRFAC
jgi:DNA-binding transcriptional LysR family regulator